MNDDLPDDFGHVISQEDAANWPDEEYGREPITVQCANCGDEVLVTSATYDDLSREWVCEDCLNGGERTQPGNITGGRYA